LIWVLSVVLIGIVRHEEVILSILFLLEFSQDVANHVLGLLHAFLLDFLVLLCFLGIVVIKFRLFVLFWPQ
jgi:hypothetical protein